jgi:hypothetical protein
MKAAHLSSLQMLEWGYPKLVSFLNVNNLVFILALAFPSSLCLMEFP